MKISTLMKKALPLALLMYATGSVGQAAETLSNWVEQTTKDINGPDPGGIVTVGWISYYNSGQGAKCTMKPEPGWEQRPRAELVRPAILTKGKKYKITFYSRIDFDPNNKTVKNPGGIILQLPKSNGGNGIPNFVFQPQALGGSDLNAGKYGPYYLKNQADTQKYIDPFVENWTSNHLIVEKRNKIVVEVGVAQSGGSIKISINDVLRITRTNVSTSGTAGAQVIVGCYNGGSQYSWRYGSNSVDSLVIQEIAW